MTEYLPGGWVLLAGAQRWLFAQVAPGAPLVALCWPLVERGASLDEVLGVIAHEGLRAVGSFAAVSRRSDGGVRIIVRGATAVEVRPLGGDAVDVRAVDVATWLDREFDAVISQVVIRGDEAPDAARLPLVSGVALASGVWINLHTAPGAAVGVSAVPSAPAESESGPAAGGVPPSQPLAPSRPAWPQPEPVLPAARGYATDTSHRLHRLVQPNLATPTALPEANEVISELPWLPPPPPEPGRPVSWTATNGNAQQGSGHSADTPVHATRIRPRAKGDAATVPAVFCARAHPNPPGAHACRDCDEAVPPGQQPRGVQRPVLGVLRPLAGGEPIVLERDVVLGRDPRGSFAPGGPNVIRVPSPNMEVSATHLMVVLDGWTVTVEDLASRNGTTVDDAGATRELRPREPTAIEPGTVVTLGGEVALRYEAAPRYEVGHP